MNSELKPIDLIDKIQLRTHQAQAIVRAFAIAQTSECAELQDGDPDAIATAVGDLLDEAYQAANALWALNTANGKPDSAA